mmetsp:Transcript_437/g.1793  ORF Transcript_437/g.1793 Transcript_437/m.1793 type:complete len:219 (-) Transcript_437:840-1496(-)
MIFRTIFGSTLLMFLITAGGNCEFTGPSGTMSMLLGGRPRPRLTPGGNTGMGMPAAIIAAFFAAAKPGFGPGLPLRSSLPAPERLSRAPRSRFCGTGTAPFLILCNARSAFALRPPTPTAARTSSSSSSSSSSLQIAAGFRPARAASFSRFFPLAQNACGACSARPAREADPGAPESLSGLIARGLTRAAAATSASASFIAARFARARFFCCSYAYAS